MREEALRQGASCAAALEAVVRQGVPILRLAALEILFKLDGVRCRALALEAFERDPDNEVRGAAAAMLGGLRDRASLDALLRALRQRSHFIAEGALRALYGRNDLDSGELLGLWNASRRDARAAKERAASSGGAGQPAGQDEAILLSERLGRLLAPRMSEPAPRVYLFRPIGSYDRALLEDVLGLCCLSDAAAATALLLDVLERGPGELRLKAVRELARRGLGREQAGRLAAAIGRGFWPNNDVSEHDLKGVVGALFAHDAGWAFDRLAPALDASECADEFGTKRAEGVLSHLGHALYCASSEGDGGAPGEGAPPPPDPRWRAPCEALLASVGEGPGRPKRKALYGAEGARRAAEHAKFVAAGLRWFEGGRPHKAPLEVELGQDEGGPLPLFIAGFLLDDVDEVVERVRACREGAPEGLYLFEHQYGGYACFHAGLLGFALRPGPEFVEGEAFRSLKETFVGTRGEPMAEAQRRAWGDRLGVEQIMAEIEGCEALLLGPLGQPLGALHGLGVLGFRARVAHWSERADFWGSPRPEVRALGPFGRAHERALYEVGLSLGFGAPRCMLVWANSD